jgi:hypothetical protein
LAASDGLLLSRIDAGPYSTAGMVKIDQPGRLNRTNFLNRY